MADESNESTVNDPATTDGLWAAAHQAAPLPFWSMTQHYFRDQGILISPVAGPPGTPADVIQICAPYGGKVVSWTAGRIGLPPIVPHSAPAIANFVLAKESVITNAPLLDSDGQTHLYVVTGTYVYLALLPNTPEDGYGMGATPYDITSAMANVLGPQYFDKNLVYDTQATNIKSGQPPPEINIKANNRG